MKRCQNQQNSADEVRKARRVSGNVQKSDGRDAVHAVASQKG